MILPAEAASCETCRLRPFAEGGSGSCPKGALERDVYAKRKTPNGCSTYDARPYVTRRESRAAKLHPQEAALF